jgi:hypothetical protein
MLTQSRAGPVSTREEERRAMNSMADDLTMRPWIINRINEALDQAALARAVADDIDDHALAAATLRLAEDLEAFARRFATRLQHVR